MTWESFLQQDFAGWFIIEVGASKENVGRIKSIETAGTLVSVVSDRRFERRTGMKTDTGLSEGGGPWQEQPTSNIGWDIEFASLKPLGGGHRITLGQFGSFYLVPPGQEPELQELFS